MKNIFLLCVSYCGVIISSAGDENRDRYFDQMLWDSKIVWDLINQGQAAREDNNLIKANNFFVQALSEAQQKKLKYVEDIARQLVEQVQSSKS
jgi:hypothetical protein